jgi:NADPH-dependent 2,4-dienoyl-CoA reductase/sulfur reductase-like enzyme
MKDKYDIAIIGAGPAGMAAATVASERGANVILLDEQTHVGGQIYRAITHQSIKNKSILGTDYYNGQSLADAFIASKAEYISGATVWQVSPDREIGVSKNGASHLFTADQVIIATGSQERPFPIPGWTLPGVMTAGAAQVLLKSSGVTFSDVVFIGTGPLLFLIAYQYMKAGVPIRAILETTPSINLIKAIPHLTGTLSNLDALIKGRSWIKELRASGIEFIKNVSDLKLVGSDTLQAAEYFHKGVWKKIKTANVFLHQGVVPNINLAAASGCDYEWDDRQLCWNAVTDEWAGTNVSGISIAGDSVGIGGAKAAEYQGQIAAFSALHKLGVINEQQRNQNARSPQKMLAKEMRIRPFLDTLFQPSAQFRIPQNDKTLVCRCEEVTAGTIREAVGHGCLGPNQLKSFTRCGMGPCQGRFCSLTVSEIIAKSRGVPIANLDLLRLRSPVKPLLLSELANLSMSASEEV